MAATDTSGSMTSSSLKDHDNDNDNDNDNDHNHNLDLDLAAIEESQHHTDTTTPLPPAAAPDAANYPDGGSDAWLVVLGAWCAMFCSFGWINCIGIFQTYYQSHQLAAYTPSTIAWIPSMEVFIMFACGPVFGYVFDAHGLRHLLLPGTLAHVFGLMMVSLSTEYYQIFLAQGVCSSIGASAIFYSAMNSIPTWFLRHRAAAFGVAASGSSLGGILLPIMVTKLIPLIGFAWTMRTVAFVLLGMLVIANFTIKSRIKPTKIDRTLMDFVRPLGEPTYLLLCLGCFFFFFGTFVPFNFVILQGLHHGMSPDLASYLVPIINAASTPGRIVPGIIADRHGRFNTLILTTLLSAIFVLALWVPSRGSIPIIIFSALFGFTSGAFVSINPACVAQISDIRFIGVRMGTLYLVISFGGLTGNPIAGALLTRMGGEFLGVQLFCGGVMVVATALFVASRWVQTGFAMKVI